MIYDSAAVSPGSIIKGQPLIIAMIIIKLTVSMKWLTYMVYQEGQKHRYGSTRISKIRVDPYFRYGSTRIFAGRPVNIRVDPYFYGSTRIFAGRPVYLRVDPYFTGLLAFTGRPVIYGSTRMLQVDPYLKYGLTRKYTGRPVKIRVDPYFKNTGRPVKYGSTCNLRVDPYNTGRPVFSLK